MKYINLSELFRQPDWPEILTQEQNQQLMQDKLRRAQVYSLLHSDLLDRYPKGDQLCMDQQQLQTVGVQQSR